MSQLVKPEPPGAAAAAYLSCLARRSDGAPVELAEKFFRRLPHVVASLKTAVPGATTSSGGAPIAPHGISADLFNLVQSVSIFGRLSPLFRRYPFRVKVARELTAGAGSAWRGEGLPAPLVSSTWDVIENLYASHGTIVVASRELFKFNSTAQAALRRSLGAGLARFIDSQLLDPSVSATSAHPASLTNGAPSVTSTGTTAANVIADLESLIAAIETAGDGLVWVMRRTTFARVAAKLAGVGLAVTEGSLLGIPVIAGSTSPHQIALIDADVVAASWNDEIGVDVAFDADVEMSDSPTQNGATGSGVQMVSLYQNHLVGVMAEVGCYWQHTAFNAGSPTQPAGAAYMTVTY